MAFLLSVIIAQNDKTSKTTMNDRANMSLLMKW